VDAEHGLAPPGRWRAEAGGGGGIRESVADGGRIYQAKKGVPRGLLLPGRDRSAIRHTMVMSGNGHVSPRRPPANTADAFVRRVVARIGDAPRLIDADRLQDQGPPLACRTAKDDFAATRQRSGRGRV